MTTPLYRTDINRKVSVLASVHNVVHNDMQRSKRSRVMWHVSFSMIPKMLQMYYLLYKTATTEKQNMERAMWSLPDFNNWLATVVASTATEAWHQKSLVNTVGGGYSFSATTLAVKRCVVHIRLFFFRTGKKTTKKQKPLLSLALFLRYLLQFLKLAPTRPSWFLLISMPFCSAASKRILSKTAPGYPRHNPTISTAVVGYEKFISYRK